MHTARFRGVARRKILVFKFKFLAEFFVSFLIFLIIGVFGKGYLELFFTLVAPILFVVYNRLKIMPFRTAFAVTVEFPLCLVYLSGLQKRVRFGIIRAVLVFRGGSLLRRNDGILRFLFRSRAAFAL